MYRKVFCIAALVLSLALSDASVTPAGQSRGKLENELTVVNTGQSWSKAQMEIWKIVEAYWKTLNADELAPYMHPEFMGWHSTAAMPHDNKTVLFQIANFYNNNTVEVTTIMPTGLKIHGNVAIVNYCYRQIYRDTEGKQHVENGRYTDILMKEEGKWLLIGDHGGPDPTSPK